MHQYKQILTSDLTFNANVPCLSFFMKLHSARAAKVGTPQRVHNATAIETTK